MSDDMKAVARVRVTLEIPVSSSWGTDCTIAQVYKQAVDSARGVLRRHFYLAMEPIAVITEDTRR